MLVASVLLMKPFYGGNGKVACDWLVKWVDEGVGVCGWALDMVLGGIGKDQVERLGSK